MSSQWRIASSIWFVAGIAISIRSGAGLWRIANNYPYNHRFYAGDIALWSVVVGFGILCIVGSTAIMWRRNWGRIVIMLASGVAIILAADIFRVAVVDENFFKYTGADLPVVVTAISLLSIWSLLIFSKGMEKAVVVLALSGAMLLLWGVTGRL